MSESFPTIVEVRYMRMFWALGRILLQGSVSTNLFNPMRHQVDLRNVEVLLEPLPNICLVAAIILAGIHFAPLLAQHAIFSICLLMHLLLLHEFYFPRIGFGLCLFAGLPDQENIFEGVKLMQGILQVAQCCIIVRLILSHQQKTFPSKQHGSGRVGALRPSHQRHPGGG